MSDLVFLDIESDGVHPGRKAWEIAMIRRTADGETNRLEFFVDIELSTADPFGLKVGRFYDRHPFGRYLSGAVPRHDDTAVSRYQAAELVARWTHGNHIVGVVPNFDTETLAPMLREHGLIPTWDYHLIDVLPMMVGYLRGGGATNVLPHVAREALALPWKSEDLSRAIGVLPPSEELRHTAMGDADWAMRIHDRITGFND